MDVAAAWVGSGGPPLGWQASRLGTSKAIASQETIRFILRLMVRLTVRLKDGQEMAAWLIQVLASKAFVAGEASITVVALRVYKGRTGRNGDNKGYDDIVL